MPSLIALLRLAGALAGHGVVGGVPASSWLLVGMIGAVAVIALAVLARVVVPTESDAAVAALTTHVELSVRLSQSDPDADGHTRSRAPGPAV